MINLSRTSLLFAMAAATACSSPHLVGFSPPDASTGETKTVFPSSMGDPFPVDEPVLGPDTGVRQLDVAFDGTVHLVAWLGARGVSAARLDPDGQRLDQEPIVVAPSAMVHSNDASIRVLPKDGGGFLVFWTGFEINELTSQLIPDPVYPALWQASIASDGRPSTPKWITNRLPVPFVLQALGKDPNAPTADVFGLAGPSPDGAALTVRTVALGHDYDSFSRCFAGLQVPMFGIVDESSYLRVGDRDFVAAVVNEAGGRALVVKVLPARGLGDPPPADCKVDGVVALHASGARGGTKSVRLVAVGDRAVAVWAGTDDATSSPALLAASFQVTGSDTVQSSPIVPVASIPLTLYSGVAVGVENGKVLVAVRGVVSRSDQADIPLAVLLDPVTLTPTFTFSGEASALGPKDRDPALEAFSWDGTKNLAIIRSVSSTWGSGAAAAPIFSGQAFSAPRIDQYLPGGANAQSNPKESCGLNQCLIVWQDSRDNNKVRGVRVSKATGKVVDSESFSLDDGPFPIDFQASAVTATERGFFYASRHWAPGDISALYLREIPESGQPSAAKVFPMEGSASNGAAKFKFARTASGLYFAAIVPHSRSDVFVFRIADDGTAQPVAHSIPNGHWGYNNLHLVAVGDKIVVGLQEGRLLTTAILDPSAPTTTVMGMVAVPISAPPLLLSGLGFALSAGRPVLHWIESSWDSDYSLRWAPLDDAGMIGTPQTIVTERGNVGDVQVDSDDRGLAILYARRTFQTDPYEIVLRRFDPAQGTSQGRDDVRVVATGITTVGHALVSAGKGQWLAAYAEGGNSFGDVSIAGAPVSRVYGRFIYESAEAP